MTIEERVENLERETRRLKRRNRWLMGAIIFVAGGLVISILFEMMAPRASAQSGGTAKEIRAKSFVIEDENGNVRAQLTALRGIPQLGLYDENGNVRISLTAFKDDQSLTFWGGKSNIRTTLQADALSTSLGLSDENGKTRASLNLFRNVPSLDMYDENNKIRFAAGNTETVTPEGKTIIYPESSLILFGPDGKVIWSAIK